MSNYHHLISLDDLLLVEVDKLQILLLIDSLACVEESDVVGLRQFEAREQVGDDAVK